MYKWHFKIKTIIMSTSKSQMYLRWFILFLSQVYFRMIIRKLNCAVIIRNLYMYKENATSYFDIF